MNKKHFIGKRISSFEEYELIGPITGVALLLDDENEILAGDDSGYMMEVSCPYGTQQMADDILAEVQGRTYQGYRAENALLSPAAELGDGITVNGIYSMLAHRSVVFGPGHLSEISAPGEGTLEHEYQWTSPQQKAFNRKLATTRSLISKTAEEIRLEVQGVDQRVSAIDISLDEISLVVAGLDNDMSSIEQKVDSIELSVTSKNGSTTFKLTADGAELSSKSLSLSVDAVNISGKLTADQIDATNLKVDAANITGKLTLDKMASISFSDLSDSAAVQNDIDDAYAMAEDAEAAAYAAEETVSEITYTYRGTTYIDESRIMAGTVIAGHLMGGTVELLDIDEAVQGHITITNADTADCAIEIQSNGAMRLLADGTAAALYMEAGDTASLAIRTIGSNGYHVIPNRSVVPATDGSLYVGTSYRAWAGMFSETGVTETSDRNRKKDIRYGLDDLDGFFDDLSPADYRFLNGTSGRRHRGFVAQDVRDSLQKHGISTKDFAGYVEDVDESGNPTYGLRYSEFIALLVAQVQKLKTRVAELEEHL